MGLGVVGLGILGLGGYLHVVISLVHMITKTLWEPPYRCLLDSLLVHHLLLYSSQWGGGIYTKAADVGVDLVGKAEAGIQRPPIKSSHYCR